MCKGTDNTANGQKENKDEKTSNGQPTTTQEIKDLVTRISLKVGGGFRKGE